MHKTYELSVLRLEHSCGILVENRTGIFDGIESVASHRSTPGSRCNRQYSKPQYAESRKFGSGNRSPADILSTIHLVLKTIRFQELSCRYCIR